MSNARDNILARLRGSRPGLASVDRFQREEATPDWSVDERIDRFRTRLEAVRAEMHPVSKSDWVQRLQGLARGKGLEQLLYGPAGPLGAPIEASWESGAGPRLITRDGPVDGWKEELFFRIPAAVTSARAGIAETGSLVLWPDAAEPRTLSLVPPVHFAVLRQENLYGTFSELVAAEGWQSGLPTNALLISGPSKSADIEQTLAYGIHGPVELIVLLITD